MTRSASFPISGRPAIDADTRLIRALLRARASDGALQDQLDCAELALDLGQRDLSAMLFGASCLRTGFPPAAHLRLHAANEIADLWPDLDWPAATDPTRAFSVDRAIAELARLMSIEASSGSRSVDPAPLLFGDKCTGDESLSVNALITLGNSAGDVLRQVPPAAAGGSLAGLLKGIRQDFEPIAPVRLEEHLDLALPALASLYAVEQVRRFLVANADLLDGDDAAPGLFDTALRLAPAALGPFFSNVRLIIRDARDIFGLIDVAAGGNVALADVEHWCVLLSTHLSQDQLLDLIDELGDRGSTAALKRILARMARTPGPHYPAAVVWRIRDVCLDIGAWDIAAVAQQLIALWRPSDPNEWRILAEIRAEMNDAVGVEGALERAMLMCPDDTATRQRMAAWQTGTMPPIKGGYGTSPGRRRLRRARLDAYRAMV